MRGKMYLTMGCSQMLSDPGNFLSCLSDIDLAAMWASLATSDMSRDMSIALAEIPINTTTCEKYRK